MNIDYGTHTAQFVLYEGEHPVMEITCLAEDGADCSPYTAVTTGKRHCNVTEVWADISWECLELEERERIGDPRRGNDNIWPVQILPYQLRVALRWEGYGEDAEGWIRVKPEQPEHIEEVWGIKLPDGRILTQGYSQRPLRSAEDARSDFAGDIGKPVLLERKVTYLYA
jgi:hypothetical protein